MKVFRTSPTCSANVEGCRYVIFCVFLKKFYFCTKFLDSKMLGGHTNKAELHGHTSCKRLRDSTEERRLPCSEPSTRLFPQSCLRLSWVEIKIFGTRLLVTTHCITCRPPKRNAKRVVRASSRGKVRDSSSVNYTSVEPARM